MTTFTASPPRVRRPRSSAFAPWAFVAPAAITIALISVAPLIYGIYLSFTNWSLLDSATPHLEGITAYRTVLADPEFMPDLMRTVYWTLGTVLVEVVIGLPLALLLNIRTPITGTLTGLVMLPWITPFVVLSYAWLYLYDGMYGPLHAVLHFLHLAGPASPLADAHRSLWALVLISGWKGVPFLAIALLAVRKGIPDELYEAASVDGANPLQKARNITMPALTPTLGAMCVVLGVQAFYSFDLVWLTTQGGPGDSSRILGVNLFQAFFENASPGQAAALGSLMLVLLLVLVIPVLRQTSKRLR
jgi:multiple sugar transport system permease protein